MFKKILLVFNNFLFYLFSLCFPYLFKKQSFILSNNNNNNKKIFWNYNECVNILKENNISIPCCLINLDILDRNINRIKYYAELHNKHIRIATKSIRVPDLINYIGEKGGKYFNRLMCFNIQEAELLVSYKNNRFNDILIAYPFTSLIDVQIAFNITTKHLIDSSLSPIKLSIMIDCVEHLQILSNNWNICINETIKNINNEKLINLYKNTKLSICIDYDMSLNLLGNRIHLGVHRSPIYNLSIFNKLLNEIEKYENIKLTSIMGYEAQISGLPGYNPNTWILNPFIRLFQRISKIDVKRTRKNIQQLLNKKHIHLEFFNGGGTGSLSWTINDSSITEVAVGSGFFQSSIFDWFSDSINEGAICFCLQCTRKSMKGSITCQSGGFIASGNISKDKYPVPYLPQNLSHYSDEGYGEVQTPLYGKDTEKISIGDYILFRPAKAGEIAERFNEYYCIRNNSVVQKTSTYRGLGYCFY